MEDSGSGSGRREGRSVTRLSRLTARRIGKERTPVEQNFDIPNTEVTRRKMLSAIATRWRDFKTFLTREYVFGERKNETPCLKYQITDEEWMQFRATRLDPSWQVTKRIAAQERQSKNDAPHLLSRGGYELKKKKKMMKVRAKAAGVESADCVESPLHHEMWIAARTKSDGQMTSETTRVVTDKIEVMREPHVDHANIVEAEDDPISKLLTILPRLKKNPIQLQYMDKLSVEQAQAQVYGFIEPQSIQKSGNTQVQIQQYMQTWMSESGRDIYMAPYIDGSHWQLMVIIPKEYTVVWFCSLHRKPSHEIKCQLQG
uniref:Ubiquitin-like protease family profile domain-containing protein n=1 Tax=Cajanus cajan TaxID=3821 RepID=A0A151RNG3_CAJCA|nr:hypothetical protein KK1_034482 [Cajanus cajan]